MKRMLLLFVAILLLIYFPSVGFANEIKYNHGSKTILQMQSEVDFLILTPASIPADWTLDKKSSPW